MRNQALHLPEVPRLQERQLHLQGGQPMSQAAIEKAIRAFPFWDYGLDEADPESEDAEWVPDLAKAIIEALASQQSGEAS